MEGTPFGRYRLESMLGRGGMGEVWRAHDSATDRIVAIKTLPAQYSDDPMFQQRFRREAQAAARLNSPHVIPIHDYGEIDGRLYVSMRLVEGRDLQAVLAGGPLPPTRAVRVIEQVAKALHAAHKVGLVHRDVKPSNVLIDEDDFAYLIDFGIARATDDTRLTGTGNAIGTFQYMAPERMANSPDDARADIYALACVLYECLTGQPPFAGSNLPSLMYSHLHDPPPRPSTTAPGVPVQFDVVVATGMAKDPESRYATTVELSAAANDAITTPVAKVAQLPTSPAQPVARLAPAPDRSKRPPVKTDPVNSTQRKPAPAQRSTPAPHVSTSTVLPRPWTITVAVTLAFVGAALVGLQTLALPIRWWPIWLVTFQVLMAAFLVVGAVTAWRGTHRFLVFAPLAAVLSGLVTTIALVAGLVVLLPITVLLVSPSSRRFFASRKAAGEELRMNSFLPPGQVGRD